VEAAPGRPDEAADEAKLTRMEAMLSAMLDELRLVADGTETSDVVAEATRRAAAEIGSAVPDAELQELGVLVGSLAALESVGTVRVVDAQLVGWLRGHALEEEWKAMQAVVDQATSAIRMRAQEDEREARRAAQRVL
jgi:hypothetical protein